MTTLHVRTESSAEFDARVAEKLAAIDDGQVADLDGEPVLSVPDEHTLETILSEKNLELLRATATEEPSSIRELARLVDRDIKNVSQAVKRLAEIGVVTLEAVGRAKRPRIPYDELEVTYPLRDPESDAEIVA